MNYLELCNAVIQWTGEDSESITSFTTATGYHKRVMRWVRDAWVEIQSHRQWGFLSETKEFFMSIGKDRYAPHELNISDFLHWRSDESVFIESGEAMVAIPLIDRSQYRELSLIRSVNSVNQMPNVCSIDSSSALLFLPVPDKEYKVNIRYQKVPVVLENESDTPEIAEKFHDVIVFRALMKYAIDDGSPEINAMAFNNYTRMLAEMDEELVPDPEFLPTYLW